MSQLTDKIAGIWDRVQGSLFPALDGAGVEMTEKLFQLAALLEVLRIEQFVAGPSPYQVGAKPSDRRLLARAFVAKAFYNATDTKAFRDRLRGDPSLRKICGWRHRGDVPSEATFSRAFGVFAERGLTERVHEAWARYYLGATPSRCTPRPIRRRWPPAKPRSHGPSRRWMRPSPTRPR